MSRAAYFVIDVRIHDQEGIKPYQVHVEETYKAFGGERLVAGAQPEVLEGEAPQGRVVILRFPSLQKAHEWHESPAYQAILDHRLRSADSRAYFVEGVS